MKVRSMPRLRLFLMLVTCGLWSGASWSQNDTSDYAALVAAYVERVQNLYDGTWAYTYTQEDRLEDETITRRIDPSRAFPDHDVLLAVNGEAPSAERLERHQRMLERQRRREHRGREHNARRRSSEERNTDYADERDEKTRFMDLLIPESLTRVKQEGHLLYLRFRGMEEERRHIFEHLQGLLILDTDAGYIREMQVRITEPFYPFFLTKVEEGYFSVRFGLVDGQPVQKTITWKLRGQALVIKNLDADMDVRWKDFRKVKNTDIRTPVP